VSEGGSAGGVYGRGIALTEKSWTKWREGKGVCESVVGDTRGGGLAGWVEKETEGGESERVGIRKEQGRSEGKRRSGRLEATRVGRRMVG